jgi:hypothetical protein
MANTYLETSFYLRIDVIQDTEKLNPVASLLATGVLFFAEYRKYPQF